MTNNPRELAIEKLADIIANFEYGMHPKDKSAIILAALNIEIVSKESEPKCGDAIIFDTTNFNAKIGILADKKYNHKFEVTGGNISFSSDKLPVEKIIRRNNNPVQYVENIGVKL